MKERIPCTVYVTPFEVEQMNASRLYSSSGESARSKRQHEGFSQAYSGRRMPQVASTIGDASFLGGHTVCHRLLVGSQHFHTLRKELLRQFSLLFLGSHQMCCHGAVRLLERGEQRLGSVGNLFVSHDRPPHC